MLSISHLLHGHEGTVIGKKFTLCISHKVGKMSWYGRFSKSEQIVIQGGSSKVILRLRGTCTFTCRPESHSPLKVNASHKWCWEGRASPFISFTLLCCRKVNVKGFSRLVNAVQTPGSRLLQLLVNFAVHKLIPDSKALLGACREAFER